MFFLPIDYFIVHIENIFAHAFYRICSSCKQCISTKGLSFSFIFQKTNLMKDFSPFENICFTQLIQGRSYKESLRYTEEYIEKLGMESHIRERFDELIRLPHGIVLVTGRTGSGKTTSLYSALLEIKSEDTKIITTEDPVEYQLEGINQIQVHAKIGLTFAQSLRSILRHDPDVVLVGEIRDQATATTAIQAALTGHLVLSTLHTIDAPSAIARLTNIGIEPYLIAASINAVLAQRLVRKICPNCKEQHEAPENVKGVMDGLGEDMPKVYLGRGCSKCRHSGFSGRIGIFELLVPNSEMRDMIARDAPLSELRQAALGQHMITLRQDGLAKVKNGITTMEEVLSVTSG